VRTAASESREGADGTLASTPKSGFFQRHRWLRDLAWAVLLYAAVRAYQQRDLPNGHAPALAGMTLDGARVTLDAYQGKPLLVHFWATWCGVCRAEQSSIDAIAQDHAVLSISSQSGSPAQVASYVAEHGMKARVLLDNTSELARRCGVHAFPTTFILNDKGEIMFREVGYTTELGLRARLWLASL
jgi:thiol-disulfide isomerase/thioredoxin